MKAKRPKSFQILSIPSHVEVHGTTGTKWTVNPMLSNKPPIGKKELKKALNGVGKKGPVR